MRSILPRCWLTRVAADNVSDVSRAGVAPVGHIAAESIFVRPLGGQLETHCQTCNALIESQFAKCASCGRQDAAPVLKGCSLTAEAGLIGGVAQNDIANGNPKSIESFDSTGRTARAEQRDTGVQQDLEGKPKFGKYNESTVCASLCELYSTLKNTHFTICPGDDSAGID